MWARCLNQLASVKGILICDVCLLTPYPRSVLPCKGAGPVRRRHTWIWPWQCCSVKQLYCPIPWSRPAQSCAVGWTRSPVMQGRDAASLALAGSFGLHAQPHSADVGCILHAAHAKAPCMGSPL